LVLKIPAIKQGQNTETNLPRKKPSPKAVSPLMCVVIIERHK
jgi:hypothetical protein